MLKKKEIPEDQERKAQDEVQKLTDRHVGEIDKILQQKEADLLAV
ncbi:MAG: ribosome-recycling factor, partial [Verrucomicrobiota bacterium]